ncbi:hypothetical protein NTCA1_51070 [Novosphingobium sp. TCA1]|nr:hypothetical protein NTCA1_51070 [Novosphingobium sp. TCA1]
MGALMAACSLAGCSSSASSSQYGEHEEDDAADASSDSQGGEFSYADYSGSDDEAEEAEDEREPFDEDAARDAAESELASQQYDGSYVCTVDCSGHEAGWQWRAEHGYAVDGKSNSFSEGGQAFDDALENRVDEMRDNYENGEEPEY